MNVSRVCVGIILGLALGSALVSQAAPANSAPMHKLIVYPADGEKVEQLPAGGAARVDDYGSYWLVQGDAAQVDSIQRTHSTRATKADYLNRVELLVTQFDTTVGEPTIPNALRETVAVGRRLRLVQFTGPIKPQWLEAIRTAGKVKIVTYVPNNAYLVSLDQVAEDNLKQFAAPAGPIQWIGAYHPYYKIQPGLLTQQPKGSTTVELRVAVVDDAEADATLAAVRTHAVGGTTPPLTQLNRKIVQFTARSAEVSNLAQIPGVLWVERVAGREVKDEKQDLISADDVSQQPGNAPVSPGLGGMRYLDFLMSHVGGGLAAFTNSATYPIVDIADTGFDLGDTQPAHPAFYQLGDPTQPSRVVYTEADLGCDTISFFEPDADFCGHGTFVASIVGGYDSGTNEIIQECVTTQPDCFCVGVGSNRVCNVIDLSITNTIMLTRQDVNGFQEGMGISPFGLIGSTRIFGQFVTVLNCEPFAEVHGCDGSCFFSLPALMAEEYINRARIANNSWGDILLVDPQGNLLNAGLYTSDSQSYDIGVRDAFRTGEGSTNTPPPFPLNQELIAVFAGGNAGTSGNVGGFGDITVTAPATAKNIIAVGASENVRIDGDGCLSPGDQDNSFDISGYSSFGPTLDGRFKPDLIAPGSSIYGAMDLFEVDEVFTKCQAGSPDIITCFPVEGVQSCSDLYTCGAGTSFAAPVVSGSVQLLWWYFQNRLNMLQPSPAMAKAYLLNSARYLPIVNPIAGTVDTLPSIAQGMGILDLNRMFDGVPRALRDESTPRAIDVTLLTTNPVPQQTFFSQTGQSYQLSGAIFDSTQPFRVTVAWSDVPGDPAANGGLVNDLDLQVTVGGQTYRGNVFSGGNSVTDPTRGADKFNNVESVFLPPGQTGTWSAVVFAANIAGEGVPHIGAPLGQDFALVVYNTTTPSDVPNLSTNDSCQTATFISTFPYTTTMYLSDAVFHQTIPSPTAARSHIEAFWTVGRPTQNTVINANTFGSNFGTVLSVWKGSCGSLVEEVSNSTASNTSQSSLSFTADGSNTYYIVVGKVGGTKDLLVLNINAVSAAIGFTPPALDFGSVLLGSADVLRTTTYQNKSPQPASIGSVSIEGPDVGSFTIFEESCSGLTISPQGACNIMVAFSPTHTGSNTASLVVTDDQTGSPRFCPLTGVGLTPVPVYCPSTTAGLTFGSVATGQVSAVQSVIITNCGTADMFITNIVVTGAAAGDYVVGPDGCSGSTIPAGGICTVGVTFAPVSNGTRNATLTITDNTATSPHSIPLTGKGTIPTPTVCVPGALSIGNVTLGATSAVSSVTVSNCGTAPLTISGVSVTGSNASQFVIVSDTCLAGSIPVGGACTIGLRFAPTELGTVTATLQLIDNAPGSPQTVTLTGFGNGSQPDLLINKNQNIKKAIGSNVLTPPAPLSQQTFTQKGSRRQKKVYYVSLQNLGTSSDSFLVHGDGDLPGVFTVKYFLGAVPNSSLDITSAVENGTFASANLAPGAITGQATLIRVEITINLAPAVGTYSVVLTGTSASNLLKTDSVVAQVIVH